MFSHYNMGVSRKTASDFWIQLAGTVATIEAHVPDVHEEVSSFRKSSALSGLSVVT